MREYVKLCETLIFTKAARELYLSLSTFGASSTCCASSPFPFGWLYALLAGNAFRRGKGILLQGTFKISGAYLAQTVREGAPTAFKNVTSIVFNAAVNNIIATVGSMEALAAFSAYKTTKFIFLSVSGAIISPVRMIQSMLREEKDRKTLRAIFGYSITRGLVLSVVLCAFIWFFGREIYSLIVSGAVLDETASLMMWASVPFVLNTFVCYYLAYFQAINKNGVVYYISAVLNVAALPLFRLLGDMFGSQGVWMNFAAQFVIAATRQLSRELLGGRWKLSQNGVIMLRKTEKS